ncbi:MAG TPA: DUF1830 domain-containing protein [Coleofasciculaceae cyanobacterium]|jgi:3-hydroxymyristoyl/3-hydroxydecanoyl-(acyl carrier protein) dehydratase
MTSTAALSQGAINSEGDHRILCFYINATNQIQIIRFSNSSEVDFERIVFPGQRLFFESLPEAKIEIQISDVVSNIIPCQELGVLESLEE